MRYEDHSKISFQDVLEKEKHWLCVGCSRKIKVAEISCDHCQMFRPLEMYKNLVHNPLAATEEEIECLELRRRKEKELIVGLEGEEQQATWFLVACEWLAPWKCFLENRVAATQVPPERLRQIVRVSESARVGVLPPGPVDNSALFRKPNLLRQGLQLNKDYWGVNLHVWLALTKIYGGGPPIVREALDIYSEDRSEVFQKVLIRQAGQARKPSDPTPGGPIS